MRAVKCVVWDLDGTVWPGIAVESADDTLPQASPDVLARMDVLRERGIVSCVASRTSPELLPALREHPELGERIVWFEAGWGHKSESVVAIAQRLGIGTDAIALVDDSEFERGEVASVLPEVRVFDAAALADVIDGPDFVPDAMSDESPLRTQRYREDIARQDAENTAERRDAFLASSDVVLSVADLVPADVDRVGELIARTHRFNSAGSRSSDWPTTRVRAIGDDPLWWVATARLHDRYGEYGTVGAALVELTSASTWTVAVLAASCRAAGRDVPAGLLSAVVGQARSAGVRRVVLRMAPEKANLTLRLAVASLGFERAPDGSLGRDTSSLEVPSWLHVSGPPRTEVRGEVVALVAEVRAIAADPAWPDDLRLLRDGLALSSQQGARLLTKVLDRWGLDLADDDLALAGLATLGALTGYVARRLAWRI